MLSERSARRISRRSTALDANLFKFLPELRPEGRKVIEKSGYLSDRRKDGLPMLRSRGRLVRIL